MRSGFEVDRRVAGGGLVFRDLADEFAGEPGEVLRGAPRIAVPGIAPLTASRTWSCQYRTGPDEAGRSGTASREDHTRFRCCRVGPMTPLPSIRLSYPETGASHLGKGLVPLPASAQPQRPEAATATAEPDRGRARAACSAAVRAAIAWLFMT